MKKLTPKQLAFCKAYQGVAGGNASKAARLAGYSAKTAGVTGFKLLKNPKVLTYLGKPAGKPAGEPWVPDIGKHIASPDEIRQVLSKIMMDGNAKHRDRIAAANALSKTYGMNLQRHKVEVEAEVSSTEVKMDLSKLTTEQLLQWAELIEAAQGSKPHPDGKNQKGEQFQGVGASPTYPKSAVLGGSAERNGSPEAPDQHPRRTL